MTPGKRIESVQGTGLGYTVLTPEVKGELTVEVERRLVDRATGEIKIDKRRRQVTAEALPFFKQAYAKPYDRRNR